MSTRLALNEGMPPVEKMAFKLCEAAQALGISQITIRRLVARGLIKPNRAVRHLIFSRAELDRFLASNTSLDHPNTTTPINQ